MATTKLKPKQGGEQSPSFFCVASFPASVWIIYAMSKPTPEKEITCHTCNNYKPTYWIYDGYGIPLCKVCDNCKTKQMKKYRLDIQSAYDCDEPIEDENYKW